MEVLRKPNIFAVILTMTVLASLMQLGSLNNMFSEEKVSEWMQGLSWEKTHDTCTTNCGTEVTQDEAKNVSFKPERIIIKSIKMDKPVTSVPLQNGTWAVTDKVANYAEGTSLVNSKEGNVGIFGHARPDAFLPIKNLKEGDDIVVFGKGYRALYKVTKTDIVTPNQVDVFYPQNKPVLTMITCDGPNDIHRYMVRASLVKIEKIK